MKERETAGTDQAADQGRLFRHVSTDKATLYRGIMGAFASAKRQFRLHLRPDEIAAEAAWRGTPPNADELQQALSQLVEWGNLQSQPDTARVSTLEDFYRARFLYSLTAGGEAVETGLEAFEGALQRRGTLQSVALEDILARLLGLRALLTEEQIDIAKVHEVLRDLVTVFSDLTDNAQAFMASLARSIDLQQADIQAVMAYKSRLVEYLERFIGDLVTRSSRIAVEIAGLDPHAHRFLRLVSEREARDAAPDTEVGQDLEREGRLAAWLERWEGLKGWFLGSERTSAQSEVLRARARAAIPRLLAAVSAINERRSGKSDRSTDYRVLARWFAETQSEGEAHMLWRAAFALNPARHLSLASDDEDVASSTPWAQAPPIQIIPRLRERGQLAPRGAPPKVRDRSRERLLLSERIAEENRQVQAARKRLANGKPTRLSNLGRLNRHEFGLFLAILADALSSQRTPDQPVDRLTTDGLLRIRLEPLGAHEEASLDTDLGNFCGRDHLLEISELEKIGE